MYFLLVILSAFAGVLPGVFGGQDRHGFFIQERTLTEPRPLRIYVLTVDLGFSGNELIVAAADDPDGDGPAEAFLMAPPALAKTAGLQIAVNAAPWAMIPATPTGEIPQYPEGGHCDILGWAVQDGKEHSPKTRLNWSLWQDQRGRWHLGTPPDDASPKQAISGFAPLLRKGKLTTTPSDILHPRTAVGLDKKGKKLTFVVVDGRQPGFSEGMSEHELATFMRSLGCRDALNLDGGGSSILLHDASSQNPQIINSPSGGTMRPVPVLIGLRPVDRTQSP